MVLTNHLKDIAGAGAKAGTSRGKGGGIGMAKVGAKGDFEGRRAKVTPPLEMPTVHSETQNNEVHEYPQKSSFPIRWGAGRGNSRLIYSATFYKIMLPALGGKHISTNS